MIPNLYDIETLHWKHWNTENCTLLANETQLLTKCNEGDERVLLITLIVLQMKGCLKIEVSFPASGILILIMIIVIIVDDDWSKGSHDYSFNPEDEAWVEIRIVFYKAGHIYRHQTILSIITMIITTIGIFSTNYERSSATRKASKALPIYL